jgi:hypothetical protein
MSPVLCIPPPIDYASRTVSPMKTIRRHLRAWATTWLVVQALSLSAFVPRDCCAAHSQHKTPAPQTADDPACPMHAAKESDPECTLRGTCNGPMLALPLAPASVGLASGPFAILPDIAISASVVLHEARPALADVLPDSPPPRA